MKLLIIILTLCLFSCCIQYKSDIGFLGSAKANVDLFPIEINGQTCKDNSGKYGTCSFQISRDLKTKLTLLPMPYDYKLAIDCTNALGFKINETILKGTLKEYDIKDYSAIKETFYCKGELYPLDNIESSITFRLLIVLNDPAYTALEKPTIAVNNVILGANAYKSTCCKNETDCVLMTKKTIIKNDNYKKCLVTTESGRAAYEEFK